MCLCFTFLHFNHLAEKTFYRLKVATSRQQREKPERCDTVSVLLLLYCCLTLSIAFIVKEQNRKNIGVKVKVKQIEVNHLFLELRVEQWSNMAAFQSVTDLFFIFFLMSSGLCFMNQTVMDDA